MILFPIALIWIIAVLVWIVRNSMNEDEKPTSEPGPPRRFRPRRPRGPNVSGSRSRKQTASSASRQRD